MAKGKMSATVRFFYDNTMVGGARRLQAARELAAAEAHASAQGWRTVWEQDNMPWDSDIDGDAPSEVLVAVLQDAAGNVLASCGGIGDPSQDYARTMEAELACEAMERIRADAAKLLRKRR